MNRSDWDAIHIGNIEAHQCDFVNDVILFKKLKGDEWLFREIYGIELRSASQIGNSQSRKVITSY